MAERGKCRISHFLGVLVAEMGFALDEKSFEIIKPVTEQLLTDISIQ